MFWKSSVLIAAVFCACVLGASRTALAQAGDQERVLKAYLEANMLKDLKTIRANIPSKEENFFTAYPFKSFPELQKPRVEEKQALIEFTGAVIDDKLPAKGGVLLKREDGVWLVRQILFYNKVPELLLNLPRQSSTAADKKQEPTVKDVGTAFLRDWQQNDIAGMRSRWYNWTAGEDDLRKGLTLGKVTTTASPMAGGDTFVKYSTKLSYRWGILSYSMTFKGGLLMVKEKDQWKVRPTVMVFDF